MSESAGSVLSLNLRDRQEIKVLDLGEYELQIVRASAAGVEPDPESGKMGKGARIQVILEAVGEPTSPDIFYNVWYPNDEDTEKQKNQKMQTIASFMERVGLDAEVTEIDLSQWVGCKFTGILGIEQYEGRAANVVKSITATGR